MLEFVSTRIYGRCQNIYLVPKQFDRYRGGFDWWSSFSAPYILYNNWKTSTKFCQIALAPSLHCNHSTNYSPGFVANTFASKRDRRRNNFGDQKFVQKLSILIRVSVQGVESLWGDCRFIPADWGSQQQICAILLFLKTFHYKND